MTKRKIRRSAALILCAALLLAAAACGRGDDGPAPAALKDGARFTVAVAQSPDSFNPLVTGGGLSEEFFLLCYDPLWRLDADGEPEACLVRDWSLSSDRLTWTIRLRQDSVFSDGVPVTAADVLFSYELLRHTDTIYSDYFDGISAIRQTDDYTVVISTSYVKGDMLYNPAPILPQHIWQEHEFDPASFENAEMIGSGPFVYDAENAEDGWLFRAREEYFSGAARVGEVFFASYGTETGAGRALSAGEADASFGLTDVQLTTLENVPGVELMQAMLPDTECRMLIMNTRTEFFELPSMRQMVEYCADRAWFLSMAAGGAGMTGSSFMSPGLDDFVVPNGLRGFDTAQAAALLRGVGYSDVDGDGVLEYGARDNDLVLTLYTSSRDGWSSTAATILTEDMAEIGVSVNWRKTDEPVTSVCRQNDSWDMCMYTWKGGLSAASSASGFLRDVCALAGWSDEGFESALTMLRSAEDAGAESAYARQLQQLVYDACPVVVFAYDADIQSVRSDAWTGFDAQLAAGALFRTGSAAVYMSVEPLEA